MPPYYLSSGVSTDVSLSDVPISLPAPTVGTGEVAQGLPGGNVVLASGHPAVGDKGGTISEGVLTGSEV